MRIASIDIGTNTILLLVADVDPKGITKIICEEQVVARLGKSVDSERMINQEAFRRAEKFLTDYKRICDSLNVDKIVAIGTSALRDAINNSDFCNCIFNKTGIQIDIISGDEEAQLTYRGGSADFKSLSDNFCVIDIGGGSTEIIIGNKEKIISKASIDIGSVRITERFLIDSPPTVKSINEARQFIHFQLFQQVPTNRLSLFVIGVAGTMTTLAAMDLDFPQFNAGKINGHILSRKTINSIFQEFKEKSVEQISMYPQVSSGRADIILAGIMILQGCQDVLMFDKIVVSVKGLRYGTVYREIDKLFY